MRRIFPKMGAYLSHGRLIGNLQYVCMSDSGWLLARVYVDLYVSAVRGRNKKISGGRHFWNVD